MGCSSVSDIQTPLPLWAVLMLAICRHLSIMDCSSSPKYTDTSPIRPILLAPIKRHLSVTDYSFCPKTQTPLHYCQFSWFRYTDTSTLWPFLLVPTHRHVIASSRVPIWRHLSIKTCSPGADTQTSTRYIQGPVPEGIISPNPGFKFCSVFVFYHPLYNLG